MLVHMNTIFILDLLRKKSILKVEKEVKIRLLHAFVSLTILFMASFLADFCITFCHQ